MRIRDLYGYPLRDLFSRRMRRMIRSASKNFVPRPERYSRYPQCDGTNMYVRTFRLLAYWEKREWGSLALTQTTK